MTRARQWLAEHGAPAPTGGHARMYRVGRNERDFITATAVSTVAKAVMMMIGS